MLPAFVVPLTDAEKLWKLPSRKGTGFCNLSDWRSMGDVESKLALV